MVETVTIEPDMQRQFHRLAQEASRPEAELIREALTGYLSADRNFVSVLQQRVAGADRGDFASDAEAADFFANHGQ